MRYNLILLSIIMGLAVVALSHATYVNITEPFNATVQQNGSIYLGKVGPGQTFYVTISAATTNVSGAIVNDRMGRAFRIIAAWRVAHAKFPALYTPYPSVKIAVRRRRPTEHTHSTLPR